MLSKITRADLLGIGFLVALGLLLLGSRGSGGAGGRLLKVKSLKDEIPVLRDREAVVHETFAILEYLEYLAPGHLPNEPAARARALTRFHESSELKAVGMRALAYLMRTPDEQRDEQVLAEHGRDLVAELDRWDGYARGAPFLAGEALSLADVAVPWAFT